MQDYFDEEGFTEVETPMLIKPTPEGARDYLVPSRIQKGSFMLFPVSSDIQAVAHGGGTDSICRLSNVSDEDLRADRQPEFTQIDLRCPLWKKRISMKSRRLEAT